MQKPYTLTQPINNFTETLAHNFFGGDILIFKTNIQTQGDKFYIKPFLDRHPLISEWNIDLEDIDCVLRVVTLHLDHDDIIDLVTKRGYYCKELI